MSNTLRKSDQHLRRLLAEGDPASDEGELTPVEAGRLRARLAAEREAADGRLRLWIWVPVGIAAVTVLAVVAISRDLGRTPEAAGLGPVVSTGAVEVEIRPQTRQVHLVASGGTRILWVVNPDLPF